jgi:protein-S-isoprenylcysteine O-methyltransferase
VEYFFEAFFFNKKFGTIARIGTLVACLSQMLRTSAMITAGSNFTHIIRYSKQGNHKLVTWGVYRFFRHPSYTGFFYWSLGLQIIMGNPICFIGYIWALNRFFKSRIEVEEELLEEFFGEQYVSYKKRTRVWIPL